MTGPARFSTLCVALHPWRAVYVTNYKVASTSILNALAGVLGVRDTMNDPNDAHVRDREVFDTPRSSTHDSLAEARLAHPGYRAFTFVRHPLARVLSAYSNKISDARPNERNVVERHANYLSKGMPFEAFVAALPRIPLKELDKHIRPQWTFCDDGVDFVGRLERLEDDWQELCKTLGMPHAPLPAQNRSRRSERENVLTEASLAGVRDFYREDFDRFGYTCPSVPRASDAPSLPVVIVAPPFSGAQRVAEAIATACDLRTSDADERTSGRGVRWVTLLQRPSTIASLADVLERFPSAAVITVSIDPELLLLRAKHRRPGVGPDRLRDIVRRSVRAIRDSEALPREHVRVTLPSDLSDPLTTSHRLADSLGLGLDAWSRLCTELQSVVPPALASGARVWASTRRGSMSPDELYALDAVAEGLTRDFPGLFPAGGPAQVV
ncbi:MAG: sulfotransferase family protein [Planctomycetota bacterium]